MLDVLAKENIQVLLPADTEFVARQDSYWSNTAKITPTCIVRPKSANDVSITIKTLVKANEKFAIRSGGHAQYAGANNIAGGVTIDLGLLNWTRFDENSNTVDLGPGGRWREVYAELEKHGRVVAGGRDGNVGVAGLILGGGFTFFAARHGFACNEVIAYEVVLADGRIITADADINEDLFSVLKGGSNNFGVVTNFKLKTHSSRQVWAGLNFFPKHVTPDAITALVRFTDNAHEDPDSHLLFFFTYLDIVIVSAYVQLEGVERAPAYGQFLAQPATMDTTKLTRVAEVVDEYDIAPENYYNTFFTATFKNDASIVAKASELHARLVEELQRAVPDGDFITQCLIQPLPKLYGELSKKSGGSIMGVEDQTVNGLLFVAVVMVKTPEQEAFVYPKVKAWVDDLRKFASTIENGNLPWIYMNYADKSQDVLGSYGIENVMKMKDAAANYDPKQIFQKLCPGGFKISHVKY
ncbi:FAD-binding domain-containing protein [Annulohypoxylon stygium]|nr:FAD-binding domain-containing protein [Annulohypoxylon stygium]